MLGTYYTIVLYYITYCYGMGVLSLGACNLSKKKKPRALLQALGFCFGTDVGLGLLMMAEFFSPLFYFIFFFSPGYALPVVG